jgi:hypothetical protein
MSRGERKALRIQEKVASIRGEEEEIKEHLGGCGDCHLYLHELEEVMEMLGEGEEQ